MRQTEVLQCCVEFLVSLGLLLFGIIRCDTIVIVIGYEKGKSSNDSYSIHHNMGNAAKGSLALQSSWFRWVFFCSGSFDDSIPAIKVNPIVKSKQKLENGEFEAEITIIQSVFIRRIQRYWIRVRG
jgi:hypothetical protein